MDIDIPLEIAFAEEILKEADFYSICNAHIWSKKDKVPHFRFDINDKIWALDFPDEAEYELSDKLRRMYWDFEWDWVTEDFKEQHSFEISSDNNGYRILADIDIDTWWEKKEELLGDFYNWQNQLEEYPDREDQAEILDEMEACKSELECDVFPNIIECAKKFQAFKEWFDNFKTWQWFDEWVVTIDECGDFDIMDYDEYCDRKEDEGLMLWDKDIENQIEEQISEETHSSIIQSIKETGKGLLKGFARNVELAKNSMVA